MERPVIYERVDDHEHEALLVEAMRDTATWPAVQRLRQVTRPALEAPAAGHVLDVGCGLADVLIDLADARPDLACVGVDLSERMLEVAAADAASRGADVTLVRGTAVPLDLPTGAFDVVRTERMLQWLDDPIAGIAELVRVTRPGGTVVAIDSDWRTAATSGLDARLERVFAQIFADRPGGAIGGHLRAAMLDAGLLDVQEHAETAVVTDWDPAARPSPPGLAPPTLVAQGLVEQGAFTDEDGEQFVRTYLDLARRGRLHFSVSMFAVTGRVPG